MSADEHLANDPTSELWGEHRARYRFAAQFAAGKRVLDVASGAGFGLQMLHAAGAYPVGVDYDVAALSEVRRLEQATLLVRADATRLPLADGSLDMVVSFETLEHVLYADAMVREIRRVLQPRGVLVLSTPNRLFGPPERQVANPFHVREFTAYELRNLLCASFSSVQLYGQHPSAAFRYVPFLMINPHLEPAAIAWKLQARLPYSLKNRLARALSGHPFYPAETDYLFVPDQYADSHVLIAVAQ